MNKQEAQELLETFRGKVFETSGNSIEKSLVPLVHIKNDKDVIDCRTGVLIQVHDLKFLVTAAHDLVKHLEAGMPPFLVMPKSELKPIALHTELLYTTNNPVADLCVTRLTDSTLGYMADNYRFLRLDSMMPRSRAERSGGFYLLVGFPNDTYAYDEQKIVCGNAWRYLTVKYRKDVNVVHNYDPDTHIIVEYERETRNEMGKLVHPPGLSGCGIWYVGYPLNHPVFRPEDFKLVGIQTSWNEVRQYAKGTWMNVVMKIIWNYFPEARAPMRLHGMQF